MSATTRDQQDDYTSIVKSAVLDEKTFLRLTLSRGTARRAPTPWIKISVRPVLIKGQRQMQFSYFDPKKDITKNFSGDELQKRLDEALAMSFSQIHVQSTSGDIHIRITRKGKALITKGKPSRHEQEPLLAHDRAKRYLLAVDTPDVGGGNRRGICGVSQL